MSSSYLQGKEYDEDSNQQLDLGELEDMYIPSSSQFYQEMNSIFDATDTNRDMRLDETEIRNQFVLLMHLLPQEIWMTPNEQDVNQVNRYTSHLASNQDATQAQDSFESSLDSTEKIPLMTEDKSTQTGNLGKKDDL
jgi:hypothetical protein